MVVAVVDAMVDTMVDIDDIPAIQWSISMPFQRYIG